MSRLILVMRLMHFSDLSNECQVAAGSKIRAVGWLSGEVAFATGSTSPEAFSRLKLLIEAPFQPVAAGGSHECDLCQFEGDRGSANLFVPGAGCLYVCPELIVHYISAHRYKPPAEFLDAVLACPDADSMPYKKAFLANGGRELLRATS